MNNPSGDIFISDFDSEIKEDILRATASIFISDELTPVEVLKSIVQGLYSIGCRHFMTWGNSAEILHELIDEALEDESLLEGVTTSHAGESANEVAWFFLNATLPGENDVRYCVIASKKTKELTEFMSELKAIKNSD